MKKLLLLLPLTFLLTGCFGSNFSKDGVLSTITSTGAAVIGTAVAGPTVGVAAGLAAGAATDAATSNEESTVDVLETIPEEDRADVLKHQKLYAALEHIGIWIVGVGAFVIFILPLLVGYFMPNGAQRRQKREMIKMKEALFDHPDVRMKDLK